MWITPPIVILSIKFKHSNNSDISALFECFYLNRGWKINEISRRNNLNKNNFNSISELDIVKDKDSITYNISELKIESRKRERRIITYGSCKHQEPLRNHVLEIQLSGERLEWFDERSKKKALAFGKSISKEFEDISKLKEVEWMILSENGGRSPCYNEIVNNKRPLYFMPAVFFYKNNCKREILLSKYKQTSQGIIFSNSEFFFKTNNVDSNFFENAIWSYLLKI